MRKPRWLQMHRAKVAKLEARIQGQAQTIHNLDRRLAEVTDVLDTIRNIIAPPWQKH